MPGEIQTSFIPKTPITSSAKPASQSSVGLMTIIGLILLLTSAAALGGAFAYKAVLAQEVENIKALIVSKKDEMPAANLQEIERLNNSLTNANRLLDSHVSSNRIFKLLQDNTIPAVRYTSFNFSGTEVVVKGTARTYEDVAAQAKVFDGMTQSITSFAFSDFTVDQTTKIVSFNLALTVAPEAFRYLGESTPTTPVSPSSATSTATTTPN